MKPCTSEHVFPHFAVYDVETVDWEYVKCLCHVDELGNRLMFRTDPTTGADAIPNYIDWLFDEYWLQNDMVWAHWGGRFDHNFVLSECFDRGYTFEVVLSGNLMIVIEVTNQDRRRIKFCESARIMPDSVEEIGKSLDKSRGSKGDFLKLDADRTNIDGLSWEELEKYCYRDCDIILEGLKDMRRELVTRGLDFAYTLASMATRHIRRSGILDMSRFYADDPKEKGKRIPCPSFYAADAFSYIAYKGGRTEAFAVGEFKGPLYYYDITSCYPAAMMNALPAYFSHFDSGCKLRDGSIDIERTLQRCGTTHCYVSIPRGSMQYPLLAFKFTDKQIEEIKRHSVGKDGAPITVTPAQIAKLQHSIMYIEGDDLEGTWTNIELLELWRHMKNVPGFEINIVACAVYESFAFMKPFVKAFWELREDAIKRNDPFKKYTYKILLNSASGKLAEQFDKVKVVHGAAVSRAKKEYGLQAVTESSVPGIFLVHHTADGAFRHAAAAAYITATGRIQVWRAMVEAERQGAKVLYCDTDSIIVDKPIFGDCKSKELGAWHLEHVITRMEIWGPKLYMFETDPDKDNPTGKHYRAKGMNIVRREDKGKPEVTQERWEQFVAFHKGLRLPKPTKEGIYGFLTRLGRSGRKNASRIAGEATVSIRPRAFKLKRASLSRDTKRQHAGGTSKPLYLRSSRHEHKPPTKPVRVAPARSPSGWTPNTQPRKDRKLTPIPRPVPKRRS